MDSSAPTSRLASSAAFLSLRVLTDQVNGQFRSSRSRKPASEAIRDVSLEAFVNQLGSGLDLEVRVDGLVAALLARGGLRSGARLGLRFGLVRRLLLVEHLAQAL